MRRNKLPNSLRIAIVILTAALIVAVVLTQIHAAKDQTEVNNLLPDAKLPWDQSKEMVEQFMNTAYGTDTTSFILKNDNEKLKGIYRVYFTQDGKEVKSSMIFNFVNGKLWSYTRQFKENMLKDVLISAKFNYVREDGDFTGGFIKTSTREFYIYEKEIKENGSLELYVVYDKFFKVVRTQSRFIKIQ
jgi:hypothetical protein